DRKRGVSARRQSRSRNSGNRIPEAHRKSSLSGSVGTSGRLFVRAGPVHPPRPVPQTYTASPSADPSIAGRGWYDFFREGKLRALIATALKNNRDIRIASGRVTQARAAWRIQGSALYPQLDAVAT